MIQVWCRAWGIVKECSRCTEEGNDSGCIRLNSNEFYP